MVYIIIDLLKNRTVGVNTSVILGKRCIKVVLNSVLNGLNHEDSAIK